MALITRMSIGFAIFGLVACGSTTDTATGRIGDPRGSDHDAATGSGGTRNGSGGSAGLIGSAGVIGSAGRDGSGGSSGSAGASGASGGGAAGFGGTVTGGAPGDSGVAGAAGGSNADAAPPPRAIASSQTVTFHVTNNTGADRYVVTAGNNCTPFEITGLLEGGVSLVPLKTGAQCPCECPMPGAPLPTELHRIASGESYDVIWDARSLVSWRVGVVCNDGPSPGPRHSSYVTGVLQPVDSGRYRIMLGVEPSLPPSCSGTDPDYRCNVSYTTNELSEYAPACSTPTAVYADFFLPASGDIVVPVDIN